MTSTPMLRLDRLSLQNFRCFAECTIDLHPQLTVLVAGNGHGKTAILDAIGIALGLFIDTITNTRQLHGFDRSDVRLIYRENDAMMPVLPTGLEANGFAAGQMIRWSRSLNGYGIRARTTTRKAKTLRQLAQQIRDQVEGYIATDDTPIPILPLIAFYGTGRLWSEHRLTEGKKDPDKVGIGRMSGYIDCLSSSSSFKGFVAWYEAQMNAARDPRSSALPGIKRPEKLLAAVREATRVVLAPTQWCDLDWDFEQKLLTVEHPVQGRLPLSVLSDGIRNMIALVADIAYRCASLNPHLGEEAAHQTPGILLIDEVDMHLHPGWQQQVIDLLRQAFPAMQIITSTHSPHVLSTVDRESIRIIRLRSGEGVIEIPEFQTRGIESADILARIMGVDPIPKVQEAQWLSDYRALVQTDSDETDSGYQLWNQIVKHFGSDHPVIQEIETLRRLQDFKRLHNLPKKKDL